MALPGGDGEMAAAMANVGAVNNAREAALQQQQELQKLLEEQQQRMQEQQWRMTEMEDQHRRGQRMQQDMEEQYRQNQQLQQELEEQRRVNREQEEQWRQRMAEIPATPMSPPAPGASYAYPQYHQAPPSPVRSAEMPYSPTRGPEQAKLESSISQTRDIAAKLREELARRDEEVIEVRKREQEAREAAEKYSRDLEMSLRDAQSAL
eukprot:gene19944-23862_t